MKKILSSLAVMDWTRRGTEVGSGVGGAGIVYVHVAGRDWTVKWTGWEVQECRESFNSKREGKWMLGRLIVKRFGLSQSGEAEDRWITACLYESNLRGRWS